MVMVVMLCGVVVMAAIIILHGATAPVIIISCHILIATPLPHIIAIVLLSSRSMVALW
jgi:hypothetical protein